MKRTRCLLPLKNEGEIMDFEMIIRDAVTEQESDFLAAKSCRGTMPILVLGSNKTKCRACDADTGGTKLVQ